MKKSEKDIICVKCGNKLEDDQLFCPKCGTKVKKEKIEEKVENKKEIEEKKEIKEEDNKEKDKKSNEQKKKTNVGDIIRYIFAGLFCLSGLISLSEGQSYGFVVLLLALSLCPFFYKKFLSNYIKSINTMRVIQIVLPIVLLFVYSSMLPEPEVTESEKNNGSDITIKEEEESEATKEEKAKEAIRKTVYNRLSPYSQRIEKIELNSNTNKYDFEISNVDDEMTAYSCATDFRSFIDKKDIFGNEKLGSIKFICKNREKIIYYVSIKDISSINYEDIESNMKYYDSGNKEVKTSISKLKQKIVDDYKKSCPGYKYKDVLRNPDNYKGKRAYWFGKVVQVVDKSKNESTFRIGVSCKKYSKEYYCSDTIYVTYYGDKSFIEDDIVKMWGTMDGTQTYTSILGAKITIPKFKVEYIELQ